MTRDLVEEQLQSLEVLARVRPPAEYCDQAVAAAVAGFEHDRMESLATMRGIEAPQAIVDRAVGKATAAYRAHGAAGSLKSRRPTVANDNWQLGRFAAAAMLVIALSGAMGWAVRDYYAPTPSASETIVSNAFAGYLLYSDMDAVVPVADAHQVTALSNWLSQRVGRSVQIADLAPDGFELAGGTLLPLSEATPGEAALQLIYRNSAQQTAAVYVTAALAGGDVITETVSSGAHTGLYWANDKITCTVISDLPEGEGQLVAQQFYRELAQASDPTYRGRG